MPRSEGIKKLYDETLRAMGLSNMCGIIILEIIWGGGGGIRDTRLAQDAPLCRLHLSWPELGGKVVDKEEESKHGRVWVRI